jgi:hypothetical protein
MNIRNGKYLELSNGSSPVRTRRQTWRNGYWSSLEEAEVPHHPVDDVLLDVDVEDQSSPRQPVGLVSGAQGRECRMDLPGPTTSVGTRTDYSVGP